MMRLIFVTTHPSGLTNNVFKKGLLSHNKISFIKMDDILQLFRITFLTILEPAFHIYQARVQYNLIMLMET